MPELTPGQTIGPFYSVMLPFAAKDLVGPGTAGAVCVSGRVLDGAGDPVTDAVIEVWQANRHGRYHHPADTRELPLEAGFTGFGRYATRGGKFSFMTVMPGPVPWTDNERMQAPHLNISVFARGLLHRLATRMYFPGQPANVTDPVLNSIDLGRRATLIAMETRPGELSFDIRLQGVPETVFFAV